MRTSRTIFPKGWNKSKQKSERNSYAHHESSERLVLPVPANGVVHRRSRESPVLQARCTVAMSVTTQAPVGLVQASTQPQLSRRYVSTASLRTPTYMLQVVSIDAPSIVLKAEVSDIPVSSSPASFQSACVTASHLEVTTRGHRGQSSDGVPETPLYTPTSTIQTASGKAEGSSVMVTAQTPSEIRLQQFESLKLQFAVLEERFNQEMATNRECQYWQEEYERSRAECEKLRDDRDNFKTRYYGTIGPVGNAALHELDVANQRIVELEEKVRQLENRRCSDPDWPERPRSDFRDLEKGYGDMSCSLDSVFSGQRFVPHETRIGVHPGSALEALCR